MEDGRIRAVIFLGVLFFCFGDSDGYFRNRQRARRRGRML